VRTSELFESEALLTSYPNSIATTSGHRLQPSYVPKREIILTSALRTSSTSYQTYSNLLNSQNKSVSEKDGDIPERVERQSYSWTYSVRSSSGSISLSRLGTPLFNMIQFMLHFPGLVSDFSCRHVAPKHGNGNITEIHLDCSQRLQ
jgi:hypothetical protein